MQAAQDTVADARTVLEITGLSHRIGGRTLFDGLQLSLRAGESIAVTGPSGSGKAHSCPACWA